MNNNIIKYEEYKKDVQVFQEMSRNAVKSGAYQANESQLLNVMLSARDLGVSPMKAINGGFNIINGKIVMSASLMADRIRKGGHSIKLIEWNMEKCVLIGQRKDNGDSAKVEFTMEEAKLAGLLSKDVWKKYPKAMLYNRTMSSLARVLFSDVVGNCYSEDEVDDIKKSGNFDRLKKYVDPILESVEERTEEVEVDDISFQDAVKRLVENIEIPNNERLEEYLIYCKSKIEITLSDFCEGLINNPTRFLEKYNLWLEKNAVVSK